MNKPLDLADFSRVPVWDDVAIKAQFKETRDHRFMTASDNSSFLRRISWLFPDNGCWARAELAARMAQDNTGLPKPFKLFAFGDLVVDSPNGDPLGVPPGRMTWFYHVVPIVRSYYTDELFVFDAAIDPTQPLPYQTWLQKLKLDGNLNDVTVTVADGNAFDQNSNAFGDDGQVAYDAALSDEQTHFLTYPWEWNRQIQLGRSPDLVLGEYPPWVGLREKFYAVSGDLVIPVCLTCSGADLLSPRCLADCP